VDSADDLEVPEDCVLNRVGGKEGRAPTGDIFFHARNALADVQQVLAIVLRLALRAGRLRPEPSP